MPRNFDCDLDKMGFKKSLRIGAYCYGLLAVLLLLPHAGGVMKFTVEPPNPSYARNEGNATLVWDYSVDNAQVELEGIVYGVEFGGTFTNMLGRLYDGTVITFPTMPSAYKGRVRIEGRASLVIENINLQDNTAFMCTLFAKAGAGQDVVSIVQLIVTVAPKISLSSAQASYIEGSSVKINCTASGTPDPDVRWIRNGMVKSSGKKTAFLTFSRTNRTDAGQYTCRANNLAGNDKINVTLVVHYKPEGTTLNTSAADNTVTQGGSVTFTCHVTAAKPQVSRYRYYLNDTTLVKDSNDSQYTINNVLRSQHFGKYKCVPSNDVGDGPEAMVSLHVNVPTQFTVFPQNVQVNEANPIVLSCDASGFPEPSFTWRKDGQVVSKSKQLKIQRSERGYSGIYACTASNGVGKDKTAKAYVTVQYPPTIQEVSSSTQKSWIGQAVTLKCVSDGVPTPTLTWYKPNGSQVNSITAAQNTVNAKMSMDQDFGGYKCDADNGITPADFKIVKIEQIRKPGSPTIAHLNIQATSLTVKWAAPADDGGCPVTAYRVVILKGSVEIKNVNVTVPGTTNWNAGGLERDTEYVVKVLARNAVFEGPAVEKEAKTKHEGVPAAATIDDLQNEVTDDTVTLKWSEPQNNGKVITQYTVYQRVLTDGKPGEWIKLKTITDISSRELEVELESGKVYEFVVTATNEFGESLKEEGTIRRLGVKAFGVTPIITKKSKSKVTVVVGNVLYLVCTAEGFPSPSVTWTKDGKVLQTNINKTDFIIDEASERDAGKYDCEASNSVETVSYTVEVAIKDSSCNERALHIVYNIVILVLLVIILVLILVQRRLHSGVVTSNSPNRKICAGCSGESVVLNPIAAKPDQQSSSNTASCDCTTYAAPSSEDYMPLHPSARSWEINREQVKIIKVVGKGAFSQVAKATAWGISNNEEYTTVAVKMLKANAPESDRMDLLSELELMKKLKPHAHVIKLMGCVTDSDPLLVLIEYVPYGDLLGYLRKSRGLNDTYFKDPDVKPQTSLTAEQLMRFAWQVADGMLYLSSRKIIHRDLAARNVLVGEGEKCKVTDFGMARNVQQDDIYTKQSRGRLPVKWTAYEALFYGTYTTQSDVWSYGVLLYEILTVGKNMHRLSIVETEGGSPYPGINARQISRKLQEGFRMPKPKHVDNKLYHIMLKCWEEDPSDRPTFAKLKDTMKEVERNNRTYVNLKQYDNSLYANVEDLTAE